MASSTCLFSIRMILRLQMKKQLMVIQWLTWNERVSSDACSFVGLYLEMWSYGWSIIVNNKVQASYAVQDILRQYNTNDMQVKPEMQHLNHVERRIQKVKSMTNFFMDRSGRP